MTATHDDLAAVSPYTVNETTFTSAMFTSYLTQAEDIMDTIAPEGMPDSIVTRCTALLVAHFYEVKKGAVNVKSGGPGEFEWVQPGRTSYWIQAMDLLKQFKGVAKPPDTDTGTYSVVRSDAVMSDFKLDQSDMPSFFGE